MSKVSVKFVAIKIADLDKTPQAFQAFAKCYYQKVTIFGQPCRVGIHKPYWLSSRQNSKGVAPSHSLDYDRFTGGLPTGVRLSDWIKGEEEREDSLLFVFTGEYDDGSASGD